MYLNSNELIGDIPLTISNLVNLKRLYLYSNQLTGRGSYPSDNINSFSSLAILRLEINQFDALPDLSGLSSLTNLRMHANAFTFEHIEPNLGISSITYTPQSKVGQEETYEVVIGANHTISVSVGGNNNTYQWYKDGTSIAAANDSAYTITNFSSTDAGIYHCVINNSLATLLTLESENITIVEGTNMLSIDVTGSEVGTTCTLSGITSQSTNFLSENIYSFIASGLPGTANLTVQYPSSANQNIRFDVDVNNNISNVQVEIDGNYKPLFNDFYRIVQGQAGNYNILELEQIENICLYYPD